MFLFLFKNRNKEGECKNIIGIMLYKKPPLDPLDLMEVLHMRDS